MKYTAEIEPQQWRSAITNFADGAVKIRGIGIDQLISTTRFSETVFLLLAGRLPDEKAARLIDAVLVSAADHGMTSPSTFAGRVIASGNRRAPEAAVAGGLLAIGDAHGGAGEAAMVMLYRGLDLAENLGSREAAAQSLVAESLEVGKRLPGLGHRFHEVDPRTVALWQLAEELGLGADEIALMQAIEKALSQHRSRHHPVNVDGAIATILVALGFDPLVGRLLFLIGRCAGIATHVREELDRERPLRIKFPYVYDGPASE